jgi:large conductance mechanosensitive channel
MVKKTQPKPTSKQIANDLVEKAKDDLMEQEKNRIKRQVGGFMDFVREQGVVGLAVGLSIGTAATVFVKSLVDNLINPIIGTLLPGGSDLASKHYCLERTGTECVNKLGWGGIISNLISFLAVAAVIYFVVKGLKLDKLDKKHDA